MGRPRRRGAPISGSGRHPTRGRIPAWLPLGIVLVGILSLVAKLEGEAESRGLTRIDVTRYKLHARGEWILEAWMVELERVLAETRTVAAGDREAIEALRGRLAALPFVAEIAEAEVDWPDGLTVPLRLHQPIACLRIEEDFLPVAADGTLLPGYSYAPHEAFGGYLPVLGPHGLDADPARPFQAGDRLAHPAHLDALALAESLWAHLDRDSLARLGRVVIDAESETAFDGLPGGAVLDLEGARRVHFGHVPGRGGPGELPLATKWRHVAAGLERWAAGEVFDAFDVRWDEPAALSSPDEGGR